MLIRHTLDAVYNVLWLDFIHNEIIPLVILMRQNSIHHRLTSAASKCGIITACQRSCGKVMFSVMCLSVHGGSQYIWGILLDMFKPLFNLDLTVQGIPQIPHPCPVPSPPPHTAIPQLCPWLHPPDMFKLVYYEAYTADIWLTSGRLASY